MFMNLGEPAPVATKTASKPIRPMRSGMVKSWPMTTSVSIFTPSFFMLFTSRSMVSLGRRNSGMPYLSTPPGTWSAS